MLIDKSVDIFIVSLNSAAKGRRAFLDLTTPRPKHPPRGTQTLIPHFLNIYSLQQVLSWGLVDNFA